MRSVLSSHNPFPRRQKSGEAGGPSTSKPDIRSQPGKVKTGGSPLKRQASRVYAPKKRRRHDSSESSDEAATFVPSGDSDDDVSSEHDSVDADLGTLDEVLDKMKKRANSKLKLEPKGEHRIEIEVDTNPQVEERVEIEIDMGETRPSVVGESSGELIVPDLIVPDESEERVEVTVKRKDKRGGLRPLKNKKIRTSTRTRLRSLGMLPVVQKGSKELIAITHVAVESAEEGDN